MMTSLPTTPGESDPLRTIFATGGTYHHRTGNNVALFHHYLMRNARAWRIKINAVFTSECLDLRVFGQIFRRSVLDVVIDCEDRLRWICDRCRPDLLELWNHGAGVVVRHHVTWANRDEIATANHRARSKSIRVTTSNLLNQ